VTLIDIVIVVIAAAAAVRGWRRGLLGQAFEFGGGLLGLIAGVAIGPRVASWLTNDAGISGALIALVTVLVGLSVGQVLGFMLGQRFGLLARRARLGGVDSGLGSIFGIGVTLVAYWLLGSLLVHGPVPSLETALRGSEVLRAMQDVAQPPDVLSYVNQYLDTSRFPQVFKGLPPDPGAPVDLPANEVARRVLRTAGPSTVRIIVPACGGTQLGSGWIVAPGTIVTNAHVVAGGSDVRVAALDELGEHEGTVVLFDPRTDVAIVKVPDGIDGPPLRLERGPVGRGQAGATAGYPGADDGKLEVRPAAVQRKFEARGLDIYGRETVVREVYEMRARVRQGDSGGPFVLADGRVAGVVFAASTTDSRVGYALTLTEVQDEIRDGRAATQGVATGGCTH
jgi:S1-C subfamily serine protease